MDMYVCMYIHMFQIYCGIVIKYKHGFFLKRCGCVCLWSWGWNGRNSEGKAQKYSVEIVSIRLCKALNQCNDFGFCPKSSLDWVRRTQIGYRINRGEILEVQARMVAVGMELCQPIQELRLGPSNRSLNVSSIPFLREITNTSYSLCTKLNSYITPNCFPLSNFPVHSEIPTLFHSQNLNFKLPHSFSRLASSVG